MKIVLRSRGNKQNKDVVNDLYWYDSYEKKMLTFKGTRLLFRYDSSLKRNIPYPITEKSPVRGDAWKDLMNFVKDMRLEIVDSDYRNSVTVELDEDDLQTIERKMKELNIYFEELEEIIGDKKDTNRSGRNSESTVQRAHVERESSVGSGDAF